MRKVWPIVLLVCLSGFLTEIALATTSSQQKDQLDLFRKSIEYREMYRLPEEQKVQLTPSGQLNISFYKIDIKKALHEMGEKAGVTVAIDEAVSGEVTLQLREVTFQGALNAVLADTDYTFRKVEDVYLIELKPPPPEVPLPPEKLLPAEERPITNVFVDTDIREILRTIAAQAEVNILSDESVEGYITADLKNVPLEKALEMILSPGGYTYVWREDYYLVGSPSPANPAFQKLSKTEEIQLDHIDAGSVSRLLSEFFRPYVKVDTERNILLVSGPAEVIARIKEDVGKIDQPRRQIIIEALVMEVSKEKGKEFGVDWGWNWMPSQIAPESQIQGIDVTGLQIGYTSRLVGQIFSSLKALVREGKAEIKATPKIATLDGEEAEINVDREEYYVILAGPAEAPYRRFETITVGVNLRILPRIAGEDEVVMSITPQVSDVIQRGETEFPVVSRRRVQTTVRIKDGQTVIIGGLLQNIRRHLTSGVPFLSKIPIVGLLFRKETTFEEETELVIFITPHIVD